MQNEDAPPARTGAGWERHVQTAMLTLMLGVVGYIGTQYTAQGTRISVAEVRIGDPTVVEYMQSNAIPVAEVDPAKAAEAKKPTPRAKR